MKTSDLTLEDLLEMCAAAGIRSLRPRPSGEGSISSTSSGRICSAGSQSWGFFSRNIESVDILDTCLQSVMAVVAVC